nr:hypothetical protein [Desulfobulbaceae bacterium]
MPEFLTSIVDWINSTKVLDQIRDVDALGLFKNTYFLVPFIGVIIYYLYKQAFTSLAIMALAIGLWYFSGTEYVSGAIVNGEIQLDKLLPTIAVGVGGIGTLVYLLFIRQD